MWLMPKQVRQAMTLELSFFLDKSFAECEMFESWAPKIINLLTQWKIKEENQEIYSEQKISQPWRKTKKKPRVEHSA